VFPIALPASPHLRRRDSFRSWQWETRLLTPVSSIGGDACQLRRIQVAFELSATHLRSA